MSIPGCSNWKFYMTNELAPFLLHRLFWNRQLEVDSKEGQHILKHELFHVCSKSILLSRVDHLPVCLVQSLLYKKN